MPLKNFCWTFQWHGAKLVKQPLEFYYSAVTHFSGMFATRRLSSAVVAREKRNRWEHSSFLSPGESHREAAVEAGAIFAFNRKKLSGSYFALMVARRAMFAPYALAANAPAVSSAWPVKFV